jgi:hypothetical protein
MRATRTLIFSVAICLILSYGINGQTVKPPINLNDLKSDLTVPEVTDEPPAAGKRVRQVNPGYETWNLSHVLYLPPDWKPGNKYPVLVEYPGNGNYTNKYGDVSTGRVEDCKLGYGISGGTVSFGFACRLLIPCGNSIRSSGGAMRMRQQPIAGRLWLESVTSSAVILGPSF